MRIKTTDVAAAGLHAAGVTCIPTLVLNAVRAARHGRHGTVPACVPRLRIISIQNRPGTMMLKIVVGSLRGFVLHARKTSANTWTVVVSRRLPFHVCGGGGGRPGGCALCIMTGLA